jgi:hypothetical protein
MKDAPPNFTKQQLEAWLVIRRNAQAEIVLYSLIGAFLAILAVIFIAYFMNKDVKPILGLIGLDGIVGWGLRQVIAFYFATPAPHSKSAPKDKPKIDRA